MDTKLPSILPVRRGGLIATSTSRWLRRLPVGCLLTLTAACAGEDDSPVTCLFTDQECIEDAQHEGRDVVLVDEEGNRVDDGGASGVPPGDSYWNLTFDGQVSEGAIGYVSQGDRLIALHLVNREAVNLHLILGEDVDNPGKTVVADLTFGRGRQCAYPFGGAGSFSVEVVTADPDWVSGSYDGAVQCEDGASPIQIGGTFRIRRTS